MLKINLYAASGDNHDVIMVESFHVFLDKFLHVFYNDRDTTCTLIEGGQLVACAWNYSTMVETDISCSLVAIGREFQFKIRSI